MGIPTTPPSEAAPAYDDVINNHPVNRYSASGSTSAYTVIPQSDDTEYHQHADTDIELHAHNHHTPSQQAPIPLPAPAPAPAPAESFTQTLASLLRPRAETPHTHCAVCDEQVLTAARHKHEQERHCCTMVAVTFMSLFFCSMVLGVVIVNAGLRRRREMEGLNGV
ncbi:hypothetical protein ACJQWK_07018 [Exserohilum turcicum]|uniref:LITAF domain-containing protein n=1 Tax=Exserohilum turcicum (strain 28A) TaxID=671987 RepID=R0K8S2_EXST2|nr:uncharacterized protein SETTUDRAFT_31897 [Exserohilum turcica Et28A]EOA84642.1 hypothetical protein SETTUDRAFT_31897 [Exserohilum turcica Et28A]